MPKKKPVDWLFVLRHAAKEGKSAILQNYDITSRTKVVKRGVGGDLTLRIDEVSENAIHRSLVRDLGEDSFVFVSEELGETKVKDDEPRPVIICDPLDGSHNAQVGIPLFSLSLSVLGVRGKKIRPSSRRKFGNVDVAFIQSIMTDDEYYAFRTKGSYHNNSRLKGDVGRSNITKINTLGIECGDIDYLKRLISKVSAKQVYKFRVIGSAALSLCFLAEGSLNALVFAQPGGARTIDSPAGYLIAREVDCVFRDSLRKSNNLEEVEVGFHSKLNLIGARDDKTLRELALMVPSD